MSEEKIPGGSFLVARTIYRSRIWLRSPLYLKVFLWIIGRANYAEHQKGAKIYKRGELVTTYDEIIQAAAYYHNRRHITPTLKQIRIILEWLEKEGMILVEPLRDNERPTRADPRARTRAYVGIRIVVVNYETYQDIESYKGRDKGRPSVQLGHDIEEGRIKRKETPDEIRKRISVLRERYPDQNLLDETFQAIASTRKTNRVAESIKVAQLEAWERFPMEQVEAGMRVYLEKECANEGKGEAYLLGIIRKQEGQGEKTTRRSASTGSPLLDSYYAQNGA